MRQPWQRPGITSCSTCAILLYDGTPLQDAQRGLDNPVALQVGYLGHRKPEPAAIDFGVMLAEPGARHRRYNRCAVQTLRSCRHDDAAELRVVDPFQRSALVHVPVIHHLDDVAHRRAWNPVAPRGLE